MLDRIFKNFSFTGHFKLFGIISVVLCLAGLAGIVLSIFGIPAFNFDFDFVGGVTMEIELGQEVTRDIQDDIAAIYSDAAGVSANIAASGNSGTAVTVKTVELSSEKREEIFDLIAEKYGEDKVALLSTDYASAAIGNDLKRSAVIASLLAALFILIYITIRFELRSGLAAIICLLHDVLVMLSVFVIFRIPMNMTFIAAALTIIGYSINATIVVFDRVRENRKNLSSNVRFPDVVDMSVRQSMRRSLGTTVTTLLPILLIIMIGVSSIRIFAIPLTVGILAGGYSSTCLAGPLWNALRGKGARD